MQSSSAVVVRVHHKHLVVVAAVEQAVTLLAGLIFQTQ
jgi:hypothetical protein